MKVRKSSKVRHGNTISVRIITVEKISMIFMSKIVQFVQVTSIILIRSLLTFEENLKYKGDIPLVVYIDFETTVPTDDCLGPENRKMFAVSYVIIFAFYPDLDIDLVIIERSFGHSQEKLTSLNYLTRKQLNFKESKTLLELIDCALLSQTKRTKSQFLNVYH